MSQLSLFSADLIPPALTDLGGLLAADGELTTTDDGVGISIRLVDPWRAGALARECRVRDVQSRVQQPDPSMPGLLFCTDHTPVLSALAALWNRDATKVVSEQVELTAGFLRCWTLAAGRPAAIGFLLALDPNAPQTHEPLAAACAAAGLAGSLLGARAGGPAVRIVGSRRCWRLAEMIGTPPPEAPVGAFPLSGHQDSDR